jgi:hypothetical protein
MTNGLPIIWRINPHTGYPKWTYRKYGGPGWTGGEHQIYAGQGLKAEPYNPHMTSKR